MKYKLNDINNHPLMKNSRLKKYVMNNTFLFKINRETVARGVAIGLFVAILPILPFQSLLAILLSILLRANLSIAFLVSWLSNPFTIALIAYFNYYVGSFFVKNPSMMETFIHKITWGYYYPHNAFKDWFVQFGKAYLIGLPIVSTSLAVIGYLAVILWYEYRNHKNIK